MDSKECRTRYKGIETWMNMETGEVKEFNSFEKPIDGRKNFMITYLAEIINLMETLGNKKMIVVKYILKNMSKAENTLIMTTRELAEKSGVSTKTVTETLKQLDEAGIIERKTGAIMVNPRLINNWRANKEASMMVKYYEFGRDEKELDGQMHIEDLGEAQ